MRSRAYWHVQLKHSDQTYTRVGRNFEKYKHEKRRFVKDHALRTAYRRAECSLERVARAAEALIRPTQALVEILRNTSTKSVGL